MNFNTQESCQQALNEGIFPPFQFGESAMIPSESSSLLATNRGRNASENDGFLYQCRVSPKISARVGGNRNGKRNGFHFAHAEFFPGNECIVENGAFLCSRLGTTDPRVLVLIARTLKKGSISQHKLTRRMKARDISGGERGLQRRQGHIKIRTKQPMTPLHVLLKRKKDLNVNSTLPERRLAGVLRSRGLVVKVQEIIGPYIADIVIPLKMLVIEVDGPIHDDPKVKEWDRQRTAYLNRHGFDVVRVPNARVKDRETIDGILDYTDRITRKRYLKITRALMARRNSPSPPSWRE
jgi:very-short-patch-repair endonuclease